MSIEDIYKDLFEGKLGIFYGAGLSKASGVPMADEIYYGILSSLTDNNNAQLIDDSVIKSVQKYAPQMEDFLNRLYDDFNIKEKDAVFCRLLQFYDVGKPNWNHFFLAELMKNNLIKFILTTNLDRHLERAYGNEFNDKFECLYQKDCLNNGLYKEIDDKRPAYIKLHGCFNQIENNSIPGTILTSVAKEENVNLMKKWIDRVFYENNSIKAILILGYSCSDVYDIVKNILDGKSKSKKRVYYIAHDSEYSTPIFLNHGDPKAKYIDDNKYRKNPFDISHFDGYFIKGDTKIILHQLYEMLKSSEKIGEITNNNLRISSNELTRYIFNRWNEEVQEAGNLKYYYSYQYSFRAYYEAASNEQRKEQKSELLKNALKYSEKCKDIAKSYADTYLECIQDMQISNIYKLLDDTKDISKMLYKGVKAKIFKYSWTYWQADLQLLELMLEEKDTECNNDIALALLQYLKTQKDHLLTQIIAYRLVIKYFAEDENIIEQLVGEAKKLCNNLGREEYKATIFYYAADGCKRLNIGLDNKIKDYLQEANKIYSNLGYRNRIRKENE